MTHSFTHRFVANTTASLTTPLRVSPAQMGNASQPRGNATEGRGARTGVTRPHADAGKTVATLRVGGSSARTANASATPTGATE